MIPGRVRKAIERHNLLVRGERVIAGVSGGVDSMVLLYLLKELCRDFDLSIVVAHVNHGFRPEESAREAELVEKESNRLGFPFEYGAFQVQDFARASGLSLQDAARRIRFRFLRELLLKHRAQKIALGHNADDQVETVLIRLSRGSGLKGLKGMLPIRDEVVIRPLLETWREEIESIATRHRIPYFTDSSNLKRDYLRNRLRLDLIPLIERTFQGRFKEQVFRAASYLRVEDDYLEQQAAEAVRGMVQEQAGAFSFCLRDYRSLHPAIQWRVVRRLLDRIDPGNAEEERPWDKTLSLCQRLRSNPPSFSTEVFHGWIVEKRYDQISIRKGELRPVPPFEVELEIPGRTRIEEIGVEIVAEEVKDPVGMEDWSRSRWVAFLDYHNLRFPLRMRNFRPGDRFQPLGLRTGTQKLKEFFIDHKIPEFERPGIPLLLSSETIVWVAGHRISDPVKLTRDTKRVLKLEVAAYVIPI